MSSLSAPPKPHDAVAQLVEEPGRLHPEAEADRRGEHDRTLAGEPSAAGRDAGSGLLFAMELLTAQFLWFALLGGGLWLLLH